jgi:hypothetical protein
MLCLIPFKYCHSLKLSMWRLPICFAFLKIYERNNLLNAFWFSSYFFPHNALYKKHKSFMTRFWYKNESFWTESALRHNAQK